VKKKFLYAFLIFLVLGAVFLTFKAKNGKGEQLKTMEAQTGEIAETALAVGTIEPENEVKVKSTISGIVSEIYFKTGDKKEKGESLFKVSPNPTPLEYAEASRNIEVAEVTFKQSQLVRDRTLQLYQSQLVPKSDMDAVNAAYSQAMLQFKIAREKFELLEKGRIRLANKKINSIVKSPISGVILTQEVYRGDPVVPLTNFQPGTVLCAMADMQNMLFKGTVDEIDVGKLKPGMIAQIKIGALPGAEVQGLLERISPKARKDGNSTLFDIEISIKETPGILLRAGYSATARVKIREKSNIVVIPERLVSFEGDKRFVEIKTGETLRKQEITTGLSDGLNIEAVTGVKRGDLLVERPPRDLE